MYKNNKNLVGVDLTDDLVSCYNTAMRWESGRQKGFTMCGEIGDASDGVALDLDVRRQHLADEGLQSTKLHNQQLVLRCDQSTPKEEQIEKKVAINVSCTFCVVLPSFTTTCRVYDNGKLTVDGQVAQGSRGSSLNLNIVRLEQKENGLQCITIHCSDV